MGAHLKIGDHRVGDASRPVTEQLTSFFLSRSELGEARCRGEGLFQTRVKGLCGLGWGRTMTRPLPGFLPSCRALELVGTWYRLVQTLDGWGGLAGWSVQARAWGSAPGHGRMPFQVTPGRHWQLTVPCSSARRPSGSGGAAGGHSPVAACRHHGWQLPHQPGRPDHWLGGVSGSRSSGSPLGAAEAAGRRRASARARRVKGPPLGVGSAEGPRPGLRFPRSAPFAFGVSVGFSLAERSPEFGLHRV